MPDSSLRSKAWQQSSNRFNIYGVRISMSWSVVRSGDVIKKASRNKKKSELGGGEDIKIEILLSRNF